MIFEEIKTMKCFLLFPNQVFGNEILHKTNSMLDHFYLIEDELFFIATPQRNIKPNKMKIAYMRACMKYYENVLKKHNVNVTYIDIISRKENPYSFLEKCVSVSYFDPCDHALEDKLNLIFKQYKIKDIKKLESPMFLMKSEDLREYHSTLKRNGNPRHSTFYDFVKNKLDLLLDTPNMDKLNRSTSSMYIKDRKHSSSIAKYKTYNKKSLQSYYKEAIDYANKHPLFKDHIGSADELHIYPITTEDAYDHVRSFLRYRFKEFGRFQDVIIRDEFVINHSVISPIMNIGLVTPRKLLKMILQYRNKVPINSLEGFIRQVVGWREYMRYLYIFHHDIMIHSNVHKNIRKPTKSEYTALYYGTTGIIPFDNEVKKATKYAYAHHIVRLMIFLNMFILMELKPLIIYTWFMEVVSIDAYDWIMIPNIYAMGYFYDKAMSRPYISSSSYILKMSDYKKDGKWEKRWDMMYHNYLRKKSFPALNFYKR